VRRALIIDVETTGLDPAKDRVVEVGCILFDLVHAAPVESFAALLAGEGNAAVEVNRIPEALLTDARAPGNAWQIVGGFAKRADVFLAHRADFDRSFVPPELANAKPWACTKFHVEWPHGKTGDHLVHLALAHGVGVVHAHRALTDCDMIARLLTRVHEMGHSLQTLIARALRPRVKVQAIVSYDDREKAKASGFQWDPAARGWYREVAQDEAQSFPFPTRPA